MQTVRRLITSFTPDHYKLSLSIQRIERTFHGTVVIDGTMHDAGVVRLHSKELQIESAHIDGHTATWTQHDNDEIEFTANVAAGQHRLTIGFSGEITDSMHGMYPSSFTHDGVAKELIATQFESHHAREVFPCVDEPEAKATFDVTLTTESGVTVLGNMPVTSQHEESDQLVTVFQKTPRMSSYLLAWVIGELHSVSATTKSGVVVNIWATPAQRKESLGFALDIARRSIDFFDEYFNLPYPLPKCDHVALPDFSSGAMENWGLITYREVALLADPKTTSISAKRYIATVIAHELSHQWFGNLVTMKWWNNLWLNESFATIMEYIAVDALEPDWNIWLDFASHESIMALRRDATFGVQAVQVEVNHPDEISTLFDGAIVYAKGARLLRMLQRYVGERHFREGLQRYFQNHAYHNTEADDLWSALAAVSGKDITSFMTKWISTSGYPVVRVHATGLTQEQFFIGPHEPTGERWPIPLDASDSSLPALLEERDASLTIQPGTRLNVHDASHFVTHYTPGYLEPIVAHIGDGTLDEVGRLQLLHEQTLLARGDIMPSSALIPLLHAYRKETADSVWSIIGLTIGELKKFVESNATAEKALRNLAGSVASQQFSVLGWEINANEPESDTKLRATILGLMAYSEATAVITHAKSLFDRQSIDQLAPEIRAIVLSSVVIHHGTQPVIDQLIETYKTTSSADVQLDICSALTASRDSVVIDRLLQLLNDTAVIRTQDTARWFAYLMRNRYARDHGWEWMTTHWSWIRATFGGDKSFDDYPRYAASGLTTRQQLDDYSQFFHPMREEPALQRVIELGLREIEGRIQIIERDGEAVCQTLRNFKH